MVSYRTAQLFGAEGKLAKESRSTAIAGTAISLSYSLSRGPPSPDNRSISRGFDRVLIANRHADLGRHTLDMGFLEAGFLERPNGVAGVDF